MGEDILTEEEKEVLKDYIEQEKMGGVLDSVGYPKPEEKYGFYELFNKVLETNTTTKSSALQDNELFAVRLLLSAASFCNRLGYKDVQNFLEQESEIVFASALSGIRKPGAFLQAAITQRKELRTTGKPKKKGIFSRKEEITEE